MVKNMLENLALLRTAGALARHSAHRHSIIAENIANADTPGYRARDVAPFAVAYDRLSAPRATRAGHYSGAPGDGSVRVVDAGTPTTPNGNSVSLEDQSIRAVEAQAHHNLAMTIYSKAIDLMRVGLGRNR